MLIPAGSWKADKSISAKLPRISAWGTRSQLAKRSMIWADLCTYLFAKVVMFWTEGWIAGGSILNPDVRQERCETLSLVTGSLVIKWDWKNQKRKNTKMKYHMQRISYPFIGESSGFPQLGVMWKRVFVWFDTMSQCFQWQFSLREAVSSGRHRTINKRKTGNKDFIFLASV